MSFSLSAEFRATDFGQKAGYFLEELLKYQDCFPLPIGKTAELLGFTTQATGDKTIREWQQGGMLLSPTERGRLTLPNTMVGKLAVMRTFEACKQGQKPTYWDIYSQLQEEDLKGSQLQYFLGELQPEFGNKNAVVKLDEELLFDESGLWWLNTAVFRSGRRIYTTPRA